VASERNGRWRLARLLLLWRVPRALVHWRTGDVGVRYEVQPGDAEDNAVITVRFPNAMALLESTWSCVDHGIPTGPILYGETGTMVVERSGSQQVVRLLTGKGAEARIIQGDPLPAGRATLAEEFLHHLETGEPLHETLQPGFNLDAMAILDAGIRSAASSCLEDVRRA